MAQSNIVAVLIVRCTHTGVYADGRPNTGSVTLYDLDEITIQKNRTRAVPIPYGSGTTLPPVDIAMSTRTFVSWHQGDICINTMQGLITSEIIFQLRDKGNCGGPAGTGQSLRPAVLNIERVGGVLRFVIPDNVIPTTLDSIGFMVGEPITVTGLTGAFRNLNGDYVITDAVPGDGLAGAAAGSYLVEVESAGADIAAATLAGVNLCLSEGRVVTQFNSGGDVGGFGTNVFGYVGGQFLPGTGGGGGVTNLQEAYEGGNTIVTSATFGDIDFSGTEAISLDASMASNFTVDGADLSLGTTTSGDVVISSAGLMDLDAVGDLSVNSSGGAINIGDDADTGALNLGTGAAARSVTIGNSTGATDVTVNTGTGAFALNSTVGETLPVATLTTTGASGDSIDFFVGDNDPSGSVTGQAGSLFFRDTGATAELYLNTSAGSGTMWTLVSIGGGAGVTLQQAYDNGNTIVTSATSGDLDVSGTEAVSLDASQASNFSVAGANLTLETTTSGDVLVDSAGTATVRGETGVVVTGDVVADASAVEVFVQGATSSGATNDGGDVVIVPGNPGVGGTVGDIRLRQTVLGSEADRIAVLERFGDEAVDLFVGTSDPSGSVTGQAGSLFFRDTGATGELYLNTSTASGTTWSQVVTSASDATAILQWGNSSVANSTAARVLDPGFEARLAPLTTSTAFNDVRVTRAGTLRNLYVQHNNPGGTGATITYTVYVNAVATALTVGLASTAAQAADTVNSVAVVAGDRVRIVVTKGAVAGGGSRQPEVTLEVAA